MKYAFIMLLISGLIGCNAPTKKPGPASVEGLSSLPSNAETEVYSDNPNRVKVTLKDQAGKISAQGDFLNGMKHGTWIEYHINELVKSTTSYINGVQQGPHTEIDDRGQLTLSAYYNQGELHGTYIAYSRNNIKERMQYENGKLEGLKSTYFDTGKIQEESMYSNGKINGTSKWYDQEGNVKLEYEYENGVLIKK